MITGSYRELFTVIAETSASLTGLLFIAISLASARDVDPRDRGIQEIRAAAAYLAFVNALVVAIFALVPGTNLGYPALAIGASGVLFTLAAVRTLLGSDLTPRSRFSQVGLVTLLLVVFGLEVDIGIGLLVDQHHQNLVERLSYLLLVSILIGVARSWELVGRRQTGLFASIALLFGLAGKENDPA
jgi:membrane associated rhomboid family serine protease